MAPWHCDEFAKPMLIGNKLFVLLVPHISTVPNGPV